MELKLQNGDYVADGAGGLRRVSGQEALLQRVRFRLCARRGQFPFREDLGSRLWQLGRLCAAERQAAAKQYVAEALAAEPDLQVRTVTLTPAAGDAAELKVELERQGERFSVALEVQM